MIYIQMLLLHLCSLLFSFLLFSSLLSPSLPFPSLPFSSHLFSSLLFSSFPFLSFSSLLFPSLLFPSLPLSSLLFSSLLFSFLSFSSFLSFPFLSSFFLPIWTVRLCNKLNWRQWLIYIVGNKTIRQLTLNTSSFTLSSELCFQYHFNPQTGAWKHRKYGKAEVPTVFSLHDIAYDEIGMVLNTTKRSKAFSGSLEVSGPSKIWIKTFTAFSLLYTGAALEALSVLMLCAPRNRRQPFSYHTKMADFEFFVFCPFYRETNWHNLGKVYWIWQVATAVSNVSTLKELSWQM